MEDRLKPPKFRAEIMSRIAEIYYKLQTKGDYETSKNDPSTIQELTGCTKQTAVEYTKLLRYLDNCREGVEEKIREEREKEERIIDEEQRKKEIQESLPEGVVEIEGLYFSGKKFSELSNKQLEQYGEVLQNPTWQGVKDAINDEYYEQLKRKEERIAEQQYFEANKERILKERAEAKKRYRRKHNPTPEEREFDKKKKLIEDLIEKQARYAQNKA